MIGTAIGAIIIVLTCAVGTWMAMNSLQTSNDQFEIDVLDLVGIARDTFQTQADADGWMRTEHPLLGGLSPIQAAHTKAGATRVSQILTAMKWGGAV